MTTQTHSDSIVEKWMPVLKKCTEVSPDKYPLLAQSIENQYNHHFFMSQLLGEEPYQALEDFTRFSLPILRNSVPFLGIDPLVGVQGAVGGMIVHHTADKTRTPVCEFKHHRTVALSLADVGVDRNTPDAERKLTTLIGNQIIRHIDNFVIEELFEAATKYDDLQRAIAETVATWVVASRNTIDKHPAFREIKNKRGGHVFDDLYEGGYRSELRPDGTYFGAQVYVHAGLEDGKVLVGRYDDDFTSNYILSIDALLLRNSNVDDDELSSAELDLIEDRKINIVSSLGSHKFDMSAYGCVELP